MEQTSFSRWLALLALPLILLATGCPELFADLDGGPGQGGEGGSAGGQPQAGSGGMSTAGEGGAGGVAGGAGFYPDPNWEVGAPEETDLDLTLLEEAGTFAESIGSHCLLVVRRGKIVFERYLNGAKQGQLHDSGSMGMAFTSLLVGVLLEQGEIGNVDDPAAYYLPEWQGTDKEKLTLRHLLTMTPGLEFDLIKDYTFMAADKKWTESALSRAVAREPGSLFEYSQMTAQVFDPIIRNAAGLDVEGFARKSLWGPLGFDFRTSYARNDQGNPALFGGVLATCRDMARLGYLMLWQGVWNGQRIVGPEWVAASTRPDADSPNQAFNNYFWLNGPVPSINAVNELQPNQAPLFPEAPSDVFMAMGSGQNFVDIRTSTETIVVHMRPLPDISGWDAFVDPATARTRITNDLVNPDHHQMWEQFFEPAGI